MKSSRNQRLNSKNSRYVNLNLYSEKFPNLFRLRLKTKFQKKILIRLFRFKVARNIN